MRRLWRWLWARLRRKPTGPQYEYRLVVCTADKAGKRGAETPWFRSQAELDTYVRAAGGRWRGLRLYRECPFGQPWAIHTRHALIEQRPVQ